MDTEVLGGGRDIDRYQKAYIESSFEPTQARMRKRVVIEQMQLWRARRILEVGCGMDPMFCHYRSFDRFVVVEPGAEFAANAREKGDGTSKILVIDDFLENAIQQGRLKAEDFDCVLVSGLLHELEDPLQLMKQLRSIASDGTRVHVNVPNARSLHRLLAFEMGLIDDLHQISDRQKTLQQSHTFDMKRLKHLCEQAGFVVTGQGSFFIKPFTHMQMFMLSEIGLLDQRMLDGLMKLEKHLPGLGSEIYVNLRPMAHR